VSEKYTHVRTDKGSLGLWGYVPYDEAVAEIRKHYESERATAEAVLGELDAGRVRVFHQLGPWAARNRREVHPAGGVDA
jgi:hypothetical protein